ncbi:Aste57867_10130 [Aphanomyces stellatus]|uniref:Transmembrane protein 198 n=1 Tax=Aphanomyces stellatus TaxID=120398 RepID=A0A485KQ37_9STRA|nr:hypothetical protein As57867_010091 [Aphanomyces stellatus]VFT87006.1 Aste57867_10130 [Aphanomyces stellatus]
MSRAMFIKAWLLLMTLFLTPTAGNLTINGNSAFDNQINKILHWDGTRESLGVGPDIVAGVSIAVGLALVLCGYKLIRPAMFISGFAVGSIVCFVLFERAFRDKSYVATACWVAFAVGGLLLGALVVVLYPVGVFLVGAFAGLLLATQFQTSFGYAISKSHPEVVFVVLLVLCGVVGGALAVKIERPFLIVATAWAGAVATAWGIGYFAGGYPNAGSLPRHVDGTTYIPGAWWGYLGGQVAVAMLGMALQFRQSPPPEGQDEDHKHHLVVGQQPVTYVAAATPPAKGNPVRYV